MSTMHIEADQQLALAYASHVNRSLLQALFGFDAQMKHVALSNREPVFAQMRLAWWREQVVQLQQEGFVPNDPLLRHLMQFDIAPSFWTAPINGWDALLAGPEDDEAAILAYAADRGGAVFAAIYGDGDDAAAWRQIGEGWALVDLFRSTGKRPPPALIEAAHQHLLPIKIVSRVKTMRPLGVIAYLALRDLADLRTPAAVPRRIARALRYATIGA